MNFMMFARMCKAVFDHNRNVTALMLKFTLLYSEYTASPLYINEFKVMHYIIVFYNRIDC